MARFCRVINCPRLRREREVDGPAPLCRWILQERCLWRIRSNALHKSAFKHSLPSLHAADVRQPW